MLTLTVNQCLLAMLFLVPLVIWLASRPVDDYISLPDKEQPKQQETEYSSRYGAYIQSQGRYYN